MPGLSRWIGCAVMLAMQIACSTSTSTKVVPVVRREHYDPAYLNEAAIAALAAGDRGTATILLERAAVLAPGDALIRDNLAALRQGGAVRMMPTRSAPAPIPMPVPVPVQLPEAPSTAGRAIEPALPAMGIWPSK